MNCGEIAPVLDPNRPGGEGVAICAALESPRAPADTEAMNRFYLPALEFALLAYLLCSGRMLPRTWSLVSAIWYATRPPCRISRGMLTGSKQRPQ